MKANLLTVIAITLMLGSLLFIVGYYFYSKNFQCEQAPFVYGAKKYEAEYHNIRVVGMAYFMPTGERRAISPTILNFNSTEQIIAP